MNNKSQNESTIPELKIYKNTLKSHRAAISANFTANHLMGKNQALKYLEGNHIDPYKGNNIKEDISAFLNNGGEGIDLDFEEACVIFGIVNIFSNYDSPNFIECTEGQLYEAMKYDKNLSGWERQRLREKLDGLAEKRFPFYWLDGGWRWLSFDTLIKLAWGIKDNDGNIEFKDVPSKENFSHYRIELNKYLFGDIKNNFRLVNPNIGKEIREYRKARGKRPSKYDIRLYYLLLGENRKTIKRNYLKIAQAPFLMDHYIRNRKLNFIREKLNSIYQMYCDLGYLINYQADAKGSRYDIDILYLNPDRFYQLRDLKQ